jgi:hypothetical protein
MLREIHQLPCWPGLQATFNLQVLFALWLCDDARKQEDISKANIEELHANQHVKAWLWKYIHPRSDQLRLYKAAKKIAGQTNTDKAILRDWIDVVKNVSAQFQANPAAWPEPPSQLAAWQSFKQLMETFYERFKNNGLPFDAAGNPSDTNGLTREKLVEEYKALHGDRVCVICEYPLGNPQVDHWVNKAKYPLLSIVGFNLLPICRECNSSENNCKGEDPVYEKGVNEAFNNWFHPYYRPGYGHIVIKYEESELVVKPQPDTADYADRVNNLAELVNLSGRWTKEYKAKYQEYQDTLRRQIEANAIDDVLGYVRDKIEVWLDDLSEDASHYHLYRELLQSTLEPSRIAIWAEELAT